MKKLELNKETLRVLSDKDAENLAAGVDATLLCPSQRLATLCVPTVCHYRDCQ